MRRFRKVFFGMIAYSWAIYAFGQERDIMSGSSGVMAQFKAGAISINTELINPAIATAAAAVTLQWILTHWKDIFNGDISNTLAKAVGLITWFGATVMLIKHMELLTNTFSGYLSLAGNLSNLSGTEFTPGALIDRAVKIVKATNDAFAKASGAHWWQIGDNMMSALMLTFANIFTFIAFLVIALSLFVAQLEFWVMFAVAPLAFGLIPLSAFRDQGFAPIKGVISLGLRLLILGVVVAVANALTRTLLNLLVTPGLAEGDSTFDPVWYYLAGMAGCAAMAFSAGKIASSIASGSASFSGADAMRGTMQMAATAGVATAGVGALMAASKAATGALPSAHDLGKAVGSMLPSGGGGLGVSPVASGGGGGAGGVAGGALGGSPVQSRPSAESLAPGGASAGSPAGSSAGSPAESPVGSPAAGNASSAGIGGPGGSGGQNTSQWGKPPTALQKLGRAGGAAGERNAQDTQAVSFQMHVGKD